VKVLLLGVLGQKSGEVSYCWNGEQTQTNKTISPRAFSVTFAK